MSGFIIVVDVGNTSTALALARSGRITRVGRLSTRLSGHAQVQQALKRLTRNREIGGAMLCSVVPERNRLWLSELREASGSKPLVLHHRLKLGLRIAYPNPSGIGADRLANASAALYRYGSPVIVADFGTALTFDVVAHNAYLGGIIVPGLPLMTDYLAEKTALLPHLKLERYSHLAQNRRAVIGKSTAQAMAIGARLGYQGMVREIFSRLQQTLSTLADPWPSSPWPDRVRLGQRLAGTSPAPWPSLGRRAQAGRPPAGGKSRKVRLCATGGYAAWALSGCDLPVRLDPDLTLFGIARIYELNTGCENRAFDA